MAEIQRADASIYGASQAPKGMSLGEMLGIAKSQYELSKLQELYPAMIKKEQSLSDVAEIEARIRQKTEPFAIRKAESETLGSEATSNTSQLENFNKHLNSIFEGNIDLMKKKDLNRDDIVKGFTERWKNGPNANNPNALIEALRGLPENGTPTQYQQWMTQTQLRALGNKEAFEKMYPPTTLTNLGGKVAPITQGNPLIAVQQPGMQVGEGVKTGIAPQLTGVQDVQGEYKDGVFTPFGTTGGNTGGTQTNTGTPNVVKEPPAGTSKQSLITGETPVITTSGIPQYTKPQADNAAVARKEKQAYAEVKNLVDASDRSINTAESVLTAAAGSKPEQLVRNLKKGALGNTNVEVLTKSLADLTVRQAAIMGVKSDAGAEEIAKTQANPDMTVGGVIYAINRVKDTNRAFNDYLKAVETYEGKRGVDTANANHPQFTKEWAKNYDSKIFALKNIYDSNMSKEKKEESTKKLFTGMSKKQVDDFRTKAKNIEALISGDYK
jgi:hypothetical protein